MPVEERRILKMQDSYTPRKVGSTLLESDSHQLRPVP